MDVNISREVCERLNKLGFNALYLTDVLPEDTDDEKILEWLVENRSIILTRDRDFPELEEERKITLMRQSSVKITREAFDKLSSRQVFPKPLTSSWK